MEQKTVSVKTSAQIRAAVLCGLFAAFTAVFSQISLPIGPVPISCSLIAVYLAGLFLPVKTAALSQLVYLLLGIIGVPVFAGFQSGAARLAGPTGGYLLVYPVIALILSLAMVIYDKKLARKPLAARAAYIVSAMLVSLIVCYAAGTAWFTVFSGSSFQTALSLTVVPFIAGDIAKIVLCTVVTISARERLKKAVKF